MKKAENLAAVPATEPEAIRRFRGRMISPQKCADELATSEFTIHRWIRAGKIRAVKLSERCTRIDGDSLADYMASRVCVPGAKEEQPERLKRTAKA
jgi:hypothetical protein